MRKQTVEEMTFGISKEIEIVIEFWKKTKTYYFNINQLKRRPDLLKLKIIDFDYEKFNNKKSLRLIVED